MFIKRVIIKNFKSFKGSTVLDNLSIGLNVVLGLNGGGKSNFLQAIEFVIRGNNELINIHDKCTLFREGREVGYVDILFSGCDELLFGGEFSLRKELHGNVYYYYINMKRTKKKYIFKLLELCGLSLKSTFYSVNNHVTKQFINFSSEARLDFLMNNLGATTSETFTILKRSFDFVENLKDRIMQFQDHLSDVHALYVKDIKKEKQKWSNCNKLKKKKALTLVKLHQQFIKRWEAKKLKIIESQSLYEDRAKLTFEYHALCSAQRKFKALLQESKETMSTTTLLLDDSSKERNQLLEKQEKLELNLKDLKDKVQFLTNKLERSTSGVEEEHLNKLRANLKTQENEFIKESILLEKIEKQLQSEQQSRLSKIAFLEMKSKYTNKESRNKFILEEIKHFLKKITKNISDQKILQKKNNDLNELKSELISKSSVIETLQRQVTLYKEKEIETKILFSKLQIKLNETIRLENIIQHDIQNLKKALHFKTTTLKMKVGTNVLEGIVSVKKVIDAWQRKNEPFYNRLCSGYLRLVIDNFECDQGLNLALESGVGKQLFSHIIENDFIGTKILQEIKIQNLPGEVWFLPINRILTYPQFETQQLAEPLINKLEFSKTVEKAMNFCFANVLICKNLEVAVSIAKRNRCTCVTITGDNIRSNGVFKGGYQEAKQSIRTLYSSIQKTKEKLDIKLNQLNSFKEKLIHQQEEIDSTNLKLQQIKSMTSIPSSEGLIELKQQIRLIEKDLKINEKESNYLQEQIEQYVKIRNYLETEMERPFSIDVKEETQSITNLNKFITSLTKSFDKQQIVVIHKEAKKRQLENEINKYMNYDSLLKEERIEIQNCKRKIEGNILKKQLITERLALLSKRITSANAKIEQIIQTENEYKKEIFSLDLKIDNHNLAMQTLDHSLDVEELKQLDNNIKDSQTIIVQTSNKYKFIDIPHDETASIRSLSAELVKINRQIKSLGEINYKKFKATEAAKIYNLQKFSQQIFDQTCYYYIELMTFKNWLEEHVTNTLNNLSEGVEHIFNYLIPNNIAKLTLQLDEEEDSLWPFKGVLLNISTASEIDLSQSSLLSGGQKVCLFLSVVLALLFTQMCNFCTLDEMDQSLSSEIILKLTKLLKGVDTQFFASSHNELFIRSGDKLYYVAYKENRSKVTLVDATDTSTIDRLISICKRETCPPEDSSIFNST